MTALLLEGKWKVQLCNSISFICLSGFLSPLLLFLKILTLSFSSWNKERAGGGYRLKINKGLCRRYECRNYPWCRTTLLRLCLLCLLFNVMDAYKSSTFKGLMGFVFVLAESTVTESGVISPFFPSSLIIFLKPLFLLSLLMNEQRGVLLFGCPNESSSRWERRLLPVLFSYSCERVKITWHKLHTYYAL
jgi:hypothetical protein